LFCFSYCYCFIIFAWYIISTLSKCICMTINYSINVGIHILQPFNVFICNVVTFRLYIFNFFFYNTCEGGNLKCFWCFDCLVEIICVRMLPLFQPVQILVLEISNHHIFFIWICLFVCFAICKSHPIHLFNVFILFLFIFWCAIRINVITLL
jgi:hypothetical protein